MHAFLSPSAMHRNMDCTISPHLVACLPKDNSSSIYSDEGTAFHELRAECLEGGTNISDYFGRTIKVNTHEFEVTKEWEKWLQPGIDRLRELSEGHELLVETRVSVEKWAKNCYGTADAIILADDLLIVDDLKGGAGVPVSPENNPQLMIYALGAFDMTGQTAKRIMLSIDQPRNGGHKTHEISAGELLEFAEQLKVKVDEIYNRPSFKASIDACRFCPLAASCRAAADMYLEPFMLTAKDFKDSGIKLPSNAFLTPEERVAIAIKGNEFGKFSYKVKNDVEADLRKGNYELAPGLKIVRDRAGNRKFGDVDAVKKLLARDLNEDEMFKRTLLSPAQAENKVSTQTWELLQDFIERGADIEVLVTNDDPRPSIMAYKDMLKESRIDITEII